MTPHLYVQGIEKWMKDGQDDKLITYSQLAEMFLREFLVLSAEQLWQGDEVAQGFAHLLEIGRAHV